MLNRDKQQLSSTLVMSEGRRLQRLRLSFLDVAFVINTILFLCLPDRVIAQQEEYMNNRCTVCKDGGHVGLPDREIAIPMMKLESSCLGLENFLQLHFTNASSFQCLSLQSEAGRVCGCPESPCSLCPDRSNAEFPTRELPFLEDLFMGFTPTCEVVQTYLKTIETRDAQCTSSQTLLANYCGCGDDVFAVQPEDAFDEPCSLCSSGSPISLPDKTLNISGLPFKTCLQLSQAVETLFTQDSDICSNFQSVGALCGCEPVIDNSCQYCPDGGDIAYPDKPVPFLTNQFGGITPNCEVFAAYAQSLNAESKECEAIQISSGFCGCKPKYENHCEICPGEIPPPEFNNIEVPPAYLDSVGMTNTTISLTCELMLASQYQMHQDDNACALARIGNFLCGCSNGIWEYSGADTQEKKVGLFWAPCVSGILSLIGSLAIIVDTALNAQKRGNMYNQIMLTMSVFDSLASIAWAFSSSAIPVDGAFPIYGERGTDATCTLQAFGIQLGTASILFNVSLSMFYVLVICYDWRAYRLKKIRGWILGLPIVIGLGLTFGGLPFYGPLGLFCHILHPPFTESWAAQIALLFFPVYCSIFFTTVAMVMICLKVYKQTQASNKWRFKQGKAKMTSTDELDINSRSSFSSWKSKQSRPQQSKPQKSRVEHEVLQQAFFYLLGFYLCWPLFTIA